MQLSFNINSPFFPFNGIKYSFRVYTAQSIYYIDKANIKVERGENNELIIKKTALSCVSASQKISGILNACIAKPSFENEVELNVEIEDEIIAISVVCAGFNADTVYSCDDYKESVKKLLPFSERQFKYPGIFTPLVFAAAKDGSKTSFRFNPGDGALKSFIFRKDEQGTAVAEMLYYPSSGVKIIRGLKFYSAAVENEKPLIKLQIQKMKSSLKLKERSEKRSAAPFARNISLIARFHIQHASAHVFMNFEKAAVAAKRLSDNVEKDTALIKLSGWDGPYYRNAGAFEVSTSAGGREALKQLIDTAHENGLFIAAEVSAGFISKDVLERSGLNNFPAKGLFGKEINAWQADFLGCGLNENKLATLNLCDERTAQYFCNGLLSLASIGFDAFFLSDVNRELSPNEASYFDSLIEIITKVKEQYKDVFFCAETVVDRISNYIEIAEDAAISNGVEIASHELNELFPNIKGSFIKRSYSRLTPNFDGTLGVEPLGFRKPIERSFDKRIVPVLNVIKYPLNEDEYFQKVVDEAARYRALIF